GAVAAAGEPTAPQPQPHRSEQPLDLANSGPVAPMAGQAAVLDGLTADVAEDAVAGHCSPPGKPHWGQTVFGPFSSTYPPHSRQPMRVFSNAGSSSESMASFTSCQAERICFRSSWWIGSEQVFMWSWMASSAVSMS